MSRMPTPFDGSIEIVLQCVPRAALWLQNRRIRWGEITYFPQSLLGIQNMALHHLLSKVPERHWNLQSCSEYKPPDCPYVHICTMIIFIYIWRMFILAQMRCSFRWRKGSIFPVDQKPLGRVFTALQDILPTDIAMKHWLISMCYLTRVLVNDVEGSQDYLKSFEDAHYSISNI
jgi:hypothetical protein